ncbi:SWIM zinc finger family protein [Actinopolymorpha alba]|uniref:SWIM zinc finger family protein n=1 Tax=Actinopolymorpha alba TaxID=533267 RepID=UPI0003A49702|nr:SWIM zinc finger family protein [Actinopolymorpha alba]
MVEQWSKDQVLALASDASSHLAAQSVATAERWSGTGWSSHTGVAQEPAGPVYVWGECQGSGARPYRTCVDLSEPAYYCSCPSRKLPCKHALALLLLWSDSSVQATDDRPAWVSEWAAKRSERVERKAGRAPDAPVADPAAVERRARQREERVAAGLAEFDRWLRDQVRGGLAGAARASYRDWDAVAARLVDSQAGSVGAWVSRLAAVPASGEGWPGRLLEEYALLRLLTVAYGRLSDLEEPLRATVRTRVGFTTRQEEIRSGTPVRDHWQVVGQRVIDLDRLVTRRTWLRGIRTGTMALLLAFAPPGQPMEAPLVVGTTIDADLAFYPGALPVRAVIAERYAMPAPTRPPGDTVAGALASYADALARDPWLDTWPVVLADVVPTLSPTWAVVDSTGAALELHPAVEDPWPLVGLSGGHPVTIAAEWTPRGLTPLTAWSPDGEVVTL